MSSTLPRVDIRARILTELTRLIRVRSALRSNLKWLLVRWPSSIATSHSCPITRLLQCWLGGPHHVIDRRQKPANGSLNTTDQLSSACELSLQQKVAAMLCRTFRALLADLKRTWQILAAPRYGLPADQLHTAAAGAIAQAHRLRRLVESRVDDGLFVEAHDDLRPEYIFLLEPEPVIIDCLEFNRALRILDPADDLGFLALECERLGLPWALEILFEPYC